MSTSAVLRSPSGETVVRDVVDGRWAEHGRAGAETIGHGLWAVPGLVDAHAHLATEELDFEPGNVDGAAARARAALAAGVTLILDKGWRDDTTMEVIDTIPPGERPEIEAAATIIASEGGYMRGFGHQIEPDELTRFVTEEAGRGRGWVKLIGDWPRKGFGPVANFDVDQLRSAVAVAGSLGARVAIHTMARDVPSAAVQAGVHSIEHGLFLTEDDLGALGARGGHWVPTILRVEATMAQIGPDSSGGRLLAEGLARTRANLPLAIEAGVRVLAGTDLVGSPADVAAEAFRLAEMGLSPAQVLTAVTTAGFAGTERHYRFEVGAPADAVFFAASPLDDLAVLTHPRHVMRLGRVV